jgi:nicotinate-nucleotide pyrophosphorylase (carboxylating)
MNLNELKLDNIIKMAIEEDLGYGDITTDNLIEEERSGKGVIRSKEEGIIAGLPVAERVFKLIDQRINFNPLLKDGDHFLSGEIIVEVQGPLPGILKGERTSLNFLQRLSAIATKTGEYVKLVQGYPVRIVDTRKTTPLLRILEKYAVRVGGGNNHRMGLFDAVMIKDNHIVAAGGIENAVRRIKNRIPHTIKIEVEVDKFDQLKEALKAGVDIILLDNMSIDELKEAVDYIKGRVIVEASGGVNLEKIKEIVTTGVDVISIGELTHHIKSLDLSLELRKVFTEKRI